MRLKFIDKHINLWLLLLLLCMCGDVLPKNPYKSGEARADYPKGCAYLRCKRGEQCVSRKFWCRSPPCPSMLYCSKSRKESLKGPSSCEAVRCTRGYMCLVKVRDCRWDEPCEQQIARCILERDYYDGPASCVDYKCPSGLRCILRESLCAKPPCKLVKSCEKAKDVKLWYEKCKSLGCLSSHECFLRRPSSDCRDYPCKHTPDCSAIDEEDLEENEQCRGWVCPKGEDCSAHVQGTCKSDGCRISRSCHRPLMLPLNVSPQTKRSWRDDVKLNFYSKLGKNLSTTGKNRASSTFSKNNKISRYVDEEGKKISAKSAMGNFQKNPAIDQRSSLSSSLSSSGAPDTISGLVIRPTVTSLSNWLNHLRLKTGVDAIEAWIKMADKQENYEGFLEWLESVKDMLGSAAYDLWIKEVRAVTLTSPAFQKWLSTIPTSSPTISPNFVEAVPITANVSHRASGISFDAQKSIDRSNNEDENYRSQEKQNVGVPKSGAINIEDFRDEGYMSPPKIDTSIGTHISQGGAISNPAEIPASFFGGRMNEWQKFYGPDPRLLQRAYPVPENAESIAPWANQAQPFQPFDTADPTNAWYQPLQRPPDDKSRFPNYDNWLDQFSTIIDSQRNRGFPDGRFLQSTNPNQQFQTNWSLQQPPIADTNFFRPTSWNENQFDPPANSPRDRTSPDRRFLEPQTPPKQQFQTDWSFQQSEDANPYYFGPNYWPSQPNQYSVDQKFPTPEKFPVQQFPTNWTFQQFPNADTNFLRPPETPDVFYSHSIPEWQPDRDSRDQLYRGIVESAKIPNGINRVTSEEPFRIYSDNRTSEDTSWLKYFNDRTSEQYVPWESFGSSPMAGENVGFESWPGSNYRGRTSLSDVPHRRTKHEDSTRDDGRNRYRDADPRSPEITPNEAIQHRELFSGSHWLVNPRRRDTRRYLQDRVNGNLYDEHNRQPSPVSFVPSGSRKIDADGGPLPRNSFFANGKGDAPRMNYLRPNAHPHDRIYETTAARAATSIPSPGLPAGGIREYNGRFDAFPNVQRPEVTNDRDFGFLFRDREFDAPLGVSDLWNSKFRTPMNPALHRLHRDRPDYRDLLEQKRMEVTTVPTPLVPFSRSVPPQQVQPIVSENSDGATDDDNRESEKKVDNFDEDDGIYPLVLSLQGYIETSKDEESGIPSYRSNDSTILPVYTVEETVDEETGRGYDYENPPNDEENFPSEFHDRNINLFKDANYGGTPDFPKNLKNVFDLEAAMVVGNETGGNDVEIKDVKWEYEDGGDDTIVNDSPIVEAQAQSGSPTEMLNKFSFSLSAPSKWCLDGSTSPDRPRPNFNSLTPTDESGEEEPRDWIRSTSGLTNEDDVIDNDRHNEVADHGRTIDGGRRNYNFQRVNYGDSLDHEEVPDHLIDSFYDDPNRRRFKKNRPE